MKLKTDIKDASAYAVLGVSTLTFALVSVGAASAQVGDCEPGIRGGLDCAVGADDQREVFESGGIFQRVVNILLFLVGAISVIMLIVGGIRYVVSAGDQQAVTNAKNTILYAIVGVIIAFVAWGAIDFVLDQLTAEN